MAALSKILRSIEGGRVGFWCPGCDGPHVVGVSASSGPNWTFDGNAERPTFSPSIRVTYNGADAGQVQEDGKRAPPACCHSFVRNGMIEFCGDSSHDLAGKTVPLPDWPAGWDDE